MTEPQGTRSFRTSVRFMNLRLCLPYVGCAFLGMVAAWCKLGFPASPGAWTGAVLTAVGVGGVGTLVTSLFALAYPLSVHPEGVRGFNFWGAYTMVPWGGMTRVTPFNLSGLPCARVTFQGSRLPLWIPLYLSEQAEFNRAVVEFAPKGNPLREFLDPPSPSH